MATYTLATWQSDKTQDAATPASEIADPLFVNAAADDFKLQGGSPALTKGVDVLNLLGTGTSATIPAGCYITAGQTDVIGTGF